MGMHNILFVFIFVRKYSVYIHGQNLRNYFGSYKNTTAIALSLDLVLIHVKRLIHI